MKYFLLLQKIKTNDYSHIISSRSHIVRDIKSIEICDYKNIIESFAFYTKKNALQAFEYFIKKDLKKDWEQTHTIIVINSDKMKLFLAELKLKKTDG
jgi:hypothetical protein